MTIKVYVAGASKEIERAEKWIAKLRELGVEVTCDWPQAMRTHGPDHGLTLDQREAFARADYAGIKAASVVWVLRPTEENPSTGAWVEMGCAFALNKTVLISGAGAFCIFDALATRFETDEDVYKLFEASK